MAVYSHSKLSTFEQCKYKYKLRYIDKIEPEIEKSIESLLGSCVHETLEWIYTKAKEGKTPTLDDVILYYSNIWQENYSEKILIVKKEKTPKDYFEKGIKFIIDYYTKHTPFNDGTIELEKQVFLDLDTEGKYRIIGYIDRLVKNKQTGKYEIHDYKTASNLPQKEKVETDRRLALYSIAIKKIYKVEGNIDLVWHYLAHNQKIISTRTFEQLEQLKQETINLIKEIESTIEFPTVKSILCDWCEYKSLCPIHNKEIKRITQKTL